MMLDDLNENKLETQGDEESGGSTTQMNSSINLNSHIGSLSRIQANFSHINGCITKDNKLFQTLNSGGIDHANQANNYNQHSILERSKQQVHQPNQQNNQLQTHDQLQSAYSSASSGTLSNYTNTKSENYSPIAGPSSSSSSAEGSFDCKPYEQTLLPIVTTMNASAIHHVTNTIVAPVAHVSEHHNHNNHHTDMHYSLPARSLPSPSPANMALNFSHDLFLHTGHHGNQTSSHHQDATDNHINKNQLTNPPFDLGSESLMQSAAVGMWKNSMNLSSHFNRPNIAEHNFLPNSEMNSFPSWPHGANISQQTTQNMTHHILDSPRLMSYSQHHQRSSLPLHNQDLVNASLKNQTNSGQATPFMLNTINHQASTSHSVFSHHTNEPPHDTLNARQQQQQQQLDHAAASYNLAMSDNQFYNSPRAENRSHPSSIKPAALLSDRPVQLSFSNHQASQLSYQHHVNNEQAQSSNLVPGSSSGNSSKTGGTFRCSHCSETFNIRNLYQSHLKTHSQERGTKAKFQCELCGHSFSQKTSLNRHMKSHTGERPFPCEVCGKAFSEKERLKIHMRTHTGEKPFSCGICGKSFSQKSTVKRHQTVHTGEKKFKCDCGKGFANRGNLIAHIKTRGSNHFE